MITVLYHHSSQMVLPTSILSQWEQGRSGQITIVTDMAGQALD